MSILAVARTRRNGRRLHPLPVRIMHWINAVAMLIMITSGWGIYDDDVIIRGLHFSHFCASATGRRGVRTGISPACGCSRSTV